MSRDTAVAREAALTRETEGAFRMFAFRSVFGASELIASTAFPLPLEAVQGERRSLPGRLPFTLEPEPGDADLRQWSRWLFASGGVHRVDIGPGVAWPHHQPTPSARCLYPARISLLTPDVDGGRAGPLRAGSYRYDPLHHQLIRRGGPVLHALRDQLGSPLRGVFAGAAVSVDWQRTHGQYGHFGYRLGLLEAGMQAAQLGIVAEALGWHVSLVWDFPDAPVNAALGMGNHERVVALVLLRRLPGTVRVPPYLPVPPTRDGGPVSLPGATLETLDRVTHLQLGPGRADGDVGPPERVTPPLLVPRTLRQTLRARHSGLAVFAPVAEQGHPDLLDDLLRPALSPAPVVDGTPDASVSIEALLNGRDGLKHHRLTRDGPPVIGGPRADPLMRTALEEVQPDMPLAHLPLMAYLCVPLHGPSPRTYRRVHLQAGLIAQRILLLAAQQGWAGRASCSFNAPRVQRLLELDGPVVPLLQLAFGREPTARLAHDHHRLSLHP